MKAWARSAYGAPRDVLEFREVATPAPADDGVLVRVHATSVNPAEWHPIVGTPYLVRPMEGLLKPKRAAIGSDVAGTVEAVGSQVTRFQPGDEVFGAATGAFAEYAAAREGNLARKPANVTFEQAASVPIAALTALQGLRDKGGVEPGQRVLVNGASGGVGTFAVQIARALGAEVTAVCSTRNVDAVRAIGADHVVDYTRQDFTRSGERHDVMLDNVGNRPLRACRRVLKPGGAYVMVSGPKRRVVGPLARMGRAFVLSRFVSQRAVFFIATINADDLSFMAELLETGKVTPVIERTYALSEVPDALTYLGEGHARGKLVVTV